MWFCRWGDPLSGHIHTGLIRCAMHHLHMAFSSRLCSPFITKEGKVAAT